MEEVIAKLQSTVDYLIPHLALANSHMVEFFTNNLWEKNVPFDIKTEFLLLSPKPERIVDYFEDCNNENSNSLGQFLKVCATFYPKPGDGITIDIDSFIKKISQRKPADNKVVSHNKFMSIKKEHEVEIMSSIVSTVSLFTNSSHVIDVGDGKGYLSSHLALQFGLKVLGLDSCNSKTMSAAERVYKLQKQQSCLDKNVKSMSGDNSVTNIQRSCNESLSSSERTQDSLYKQVTLYASPQTDLKSTLMDNFPGEHLYRFGIVGLHTCGGLSPVCLKLFNDNKYDTAFLINVGCCYHLLEECEEDGVPRTFPLSSYLKKKEFKLGRNARMLSLQAPSRIYSSKKISESLFFRALFELLLEKKMCYYDRADKKLGRIGLKCINFEDYCKKGLLKLGLDTQVEENEAEQFFVNYSQYRPLLEFYYMLRVSLAPVIENVILLDRLLYLLENGLTNSFLVKMFEPRIIPRYLGLISIRDDF